MYLSVHDFRQKDYSVFFNRRKLSFLKKPLIYQLINLGGTGTKARALKSVGFLLQTPAMTGAGSS